MSPAIIPDSAAGDSKHDRDESPGNHDFTVKNPSVNLPKGGGAIKGIGEKFGVNPVTGTGSMTIPIAVSPGRSGFGPQLSLTYDSGDGNGPFGFGWNLPLPSVTRKTDKGIPRYLDYEDSDVFILSGAEDLVPVLKKNPDGDFIRDPEGNMIIDEYDRGSYKVRRYRPRIEGLFARIERWTHKTDPADVFWRSISKDNIMTWYGRTKESRIADPAQPSHIFSWLICESHDDKGNATLYKYKPDDSAGIDLSQVHEKNRSPEIRGTYRYLKRILYGNTVSHLVKPDLSDMTWLFEVVFDYGEHYAEDENNQPVFVSTGDDTPGYHWHVRKDPFSSYRSGFEVRTYRLCRHILMFHHFPGELGTDDYLVRSTDFYYSELPVGSFITKTAQSSYLLGDGVYRKKSLPPLEFEYSKATVKDEIHEIDPGSIENLPDGFGSSHQLVDLDGEGVSGVLTEQAGGWFYKPNLGGGKFGPLELVGTKPSLVFLNSEGYQLLDLAGDGQLDLADFHEPLSGFYERTEDRQWTSFRKFESLPKIAWDDPNLRFVDLNGDGHADILITENEVLSWYPSLEEKGFDARLSVPVPSDEEDGPRLIFADGSQSVYLADMSGDGLTDIARIRNGEVCYWPNLGYGRFGPKITMDNSPWLDSPDQFDHRRIRIADIDGSGNTDIIYLGADGITLSFNQSGNRWSDSQKLDQFPLIDNVSSVLAADLLGDGTACLVWSSPLSLNAATPVRYIHLMGEGKPHLLVSSRNNLGSETVVKYAPSTKFYLEDKKNGKPWITRLPFPVHVIEQIETFDYISGKLFVTRYAYHHGYFDGLEREFRGFGMVEQWDTEESYTMQNSDRLPVGEIIYTASYVPPVYSKNWFHNGAYFECEKISMQYEEEYFHEPCLTHDQATAMLLDDTILPEGLSADEEREACRGLKGLMLRQEVYALDNSEKAIYPYSVTEQSYSLRCLQPCGNNKHAVFFSYPLEVISYHYERNTFDPRISHALTLDMDEFGNVLKSVAIGYGRREKIIIRNDQGTINQVPNPELLKLEVEDQKKQIKTLITCTENHFTDAINEDDYYRPPLTSEACTYELTGYEKPEIKVRFSIEDFVSVINGQVKLIYDNEISYEQDPDSGRQRRLIEHVRTLYADNEMKSLLPLGQVQSLALPGESYKLAFNSGLLNKIFVDSGKKNRDELEKILEEAGGYISSSIYKCRGLFPDSDADGCWWIPSGKILLSPVQTDPFPQDIEFARNHFFLQQGSCDPFGAINRTIYDDLDLMLTSVEDPAGNIVSAFNNYRVLLPEMVTDPNGNRTEVRFDILGMVAGTAAMGKADKDEGDSFVNFIADLPEEQTREFFRSEKPHGLAIGLLGTATSRFIYDLEHFPPCAASIAREKHTSDLQEEEKSIVHLSFLYSDGFGRESQTKVQAEPGPLDPDNKGSPVADQRWTGTGTTIYNNKGRPVRQYEPFFSAVPYYGIETHGVSSVLFYDPLDRVIAALRPDHTFEKVIFDPWKQETWDVNDTVLITDPATDPDIGSFFSRIDDAEYLPSWYTDRQNGSMGEKEMNAARKTEMHAGTPSSAYLDTLGRTFLTLIHNRYEHEGNIIDDKYPARIEIDIEGNQRRIIDNKTDPSTNNKVNRFVMYYDYDMLGNRIHQNSMDAGRRWMLNDVAGKTLRTWDDRNHEFSFKYDAMHRLSEMWVSGGDGEVPLNHLYERIIYGEGKTFDDKSDTELNIRGKPFEHYDTAGRIRFEQYDFKGNLIRTSRRLVKDYKNTVDWNINDAASLLEDEAFTAEIQYDAMNRVIKSVAPDGSVTVPAYNEANLLEKVYIEQNGINGLYVKDINYNEKGQRTEIIYGNNIKTTYRYDKKTFRLTHLETRKSEGNLLQDLLYTYDPVGNITDIEDGARPAVFFGGADIEPVSDYTYDALYRLIQANGREHRGQTDVRDKDNWDDLPFLKKYSPNDEMAWRSYTQKYEYDEVGNIRKVKHIANGGSWTRRYYYDDAINNRLKYTEVGKTKYNYIHNQQHGFITGMPHLQVMEWNCKEELKAVAKQSRKDGGIPETTYYVYDSSGQRIRKVTENTSDPGNEPVKKNERIYLGDYEIYREYTGTNSGLERKTLHVKDDKQSVAMIETRNEVDDGTDTRLVRYQLSNHLGTACLELDDGEKPDIISYEEFHPFGTTAYQAINSDIKAAGKRYRYTGKERDEESGFNYHAARYYAPWIGRWISCDPAGFVEGVNLYIYSNNQPAQLVDPSGNSSLKLYNTPEINDTKVLTLMQSIFTDVLPEGLSSENYPKYREAFYSRLREVLVSPEKHELQKYFKIVSVGTKSGPRTAIKWTRGPFTGEFLRIHHNLPQSAIRQLPEGFKKYAANPRNLVPLGHKFHERFAPLTSGSNRWMSGKATVGFLSKLAFGAGVALAGLAAAGEIGTVISYGDSIDESRAFINQLEAQSQEELAAGLGNFYEPVIPISVLENEKPGEHFNFYIQREYKGENKGYQNYLYVRSSDPDEPQYKRVGRLEPDWSVFGEERGKILTLSLSEKVHIKVMWGEQHRAWMSVGPRWYKR